MMAAKKIYWCKFSLNNFWHALSVISKGVCIIGMSCMFIVGCSSNPATFNDANRNGTGAAVVAQNAGIAQFDYYTVRRGDDLAKIAAKFDVKKAALIQSNNALKAPYKLRMGQRLRIPVPMGVLKAKATSAVALTSLPQHSLLWPAKGKVVRTFANSVASMHGGGSKGIDIAGALGQEVVASAAGKVVYSGNALKGYGRAIIIKHRDNVVTVYAFARHLLVREGQIVKAGERIAKMGSDVSGNVMLHFEVRINGTPQDPLLYLQQIQQID